MIFTTKEEEDFNKNYLSVLNYFNEFLKINYYLQYFEFTEISKKWSYQKQESIKEILETFQDGSGTDSKIESMLFIINTNVDVNERLKFKNSEIVSNDNIIVYKINITIINNIPINEGDKLLFTYEIGNFEVNNIYYIVEVNEDHIIIENAKKIVITDEVIYTDNDVIELLNETITKYNLEYGDRVYVLNHRLGIIVKKKGEDDVDKLFILLDEKDEIDKLEGEYVNIQIREACVADQLNGGSGSGYLDDIEKTDRRNGDIYDIENTFNDINVKEWDSRCVEDAECPFYLKNKNYRNTRGGCVNGYCEFPIGLKRISYKKYYEVINENNYPRCENCEDEDDIHCCDEQGADHDNFKGPNYIFSRNHDMIN